MRWVIDQSFPLPGRAWNCSVKKLQAGIREYQIPMGMVNGTGGIVIAYHT